MSWRNDFANASIMPESIKYIRENLYKLDNPEFIPKPATLIKLAKSANTNRTFLGQSVEAKTLPTRKEIIKTRMETAGMATECLDAVYDIILKKKRTVKPKTERKEKYMPTDTMVRLVHNHNRLLISQGSNPVNFPNCKKRAMVMGL